VLQQRLLGQIQEDIGRARFTAAFDLAERLLDLTPTTEVYEVLLRPFDRVDGNLDAPRLYELLERLERDTSSTDLPWRGLLRFALLERLEWQEEAYALSAAFTRVPERYGWMRYNRGTMLMNRLGAYDEARPELAAALRAAPNFWKAAGTLAECALCQGRASEAFAIMDDCVVRLSTHGRAFDVATATVWRGELRLWLGQYAEAVTDLAAAAAAEMPYGMIWYGAATLLLGDPQRALATLDKAVQLVPLDFEAHVWRGETHERLGQWERAIADFDRAVRLTGMPIWPLVGRALAKAGAGDSVGAMADFTALPTRITAFFQWKAGTRVENDVDKAVTVLLRMREAARGLRRAERYLDAVWMKRT
jgi:tetratricopeptide (TPR) repeat protein